MAKVDPVARTLGAAFPIGLIRGSTPKPLDMDVSPASNDIVVVTAQEPGFAYANATSGPWLFRAGQRVFAAQGNGTTTLDGITRVEFTDANTVFSHGVELVKWSLSGDTLTQTWSSPDMVLSVHSGGQDTLSFGGGRFFCRGSVIDPAGPTLIGQVKSLGGSGTMLGRPVMTDDGSRIIAVTNEGATPASNFSLRCFNAATLAQIGQPYSFSSPTQYEGNFINHIELWGSTGVVLRTDRSTLWFMPTVLRDMGCI
jgi:hypothetical protein